MHMDQLKLKLQEYYQHYRQLDKKPRKTGGTAVNNRVEEMESDILTQFGYRYRNASYRSCTIL